ncbi:MAG TPA: DEAD/DEAH box helicase [Candidatus Omnitrophota bacterium]|nr:DEAD/DEAH box helicase [Candidatus Omnitrophota bacterium]
MVETAMILGMILRDSSKPFYEINCVMDRWKSAFSIKDRILDLSEDQLMNYRDEATGEINVNVKLCGDPDRQFIIRSACKGVSDLQNDSNAVTIDEGRMEDGFIARGRMRLLVEKLEEQVLAKSVEITKTGFEKDAEELEGLLAGSGLSGKYKKAVLQAIDDLCHFNKAIFSGIALGYKNIDGGKDEWLLGFNSRSAKAPSFLKELFPDATLGYSREILEKAEGYTRLEYLLHEPLCGILGHDEAREVQETLFKETVYKDAKGRASKKDGELVDIIREVIYANSGGENEIWVGAKIDSGIRKGGQCVSSGVDKKQIGKILEKYTDKDIVVERVRLNNRGGLKINGEALFATLEGYEDAVVRVTISKGKVAEVYDIDGKRLYPSENIKIFKVDANDDEEMSKAEQVASLADKNAVAIFMKKYTDEEYLITGLRLSDRGGLRLNQKRYWENLPGYWDAEVRIWVKAGEVIKVCDLEGKLIYPFTDRLISYYRGTKKVGDKLEGKDLVGTSVGRNSIATFIKNNEFTDGYIENFLLDAKGGLRLFGECYWKTLEGYEVASINVVLKNGRIVEAYGGDGKKIYPFEENHVYVGVEMKNGKRLEGEFLLAAQDKLALWQIVNKYKDEKLIVENFRLGARGGLQFNVKIYWRTMKGLENALVTLVLNELEVVEVYDQDGKMLYPFEGNLIWVGAGVEGGKRVGGECIGCASSSKERNKYVQSEEDKLIIERFKLSSGGGLTLNNITYWSGMTGYENAYVTIVHEKGRVREVYGEGGEQIYPLETIVVYEGGEISGGGVKGGKKVGEFTLKRDVKDIFDKHKGQRLLLTGVPLEVDGGLFFNNESYWSNMDGYGDQKVTLVWKDGILLEVYGPQGEKLYPFFENNVYLNGAIKDGRRDGGDFVVSCPTKRSLRKIIQRYKDESLIFENIRLTARGGLEFGGVKYWDKLEGHGDELVTILLQKGEMKEVYGEKGDRIYPWVEEDVIKIYEEGSFEGGKVKGTLLGTVCTRSSLNNFLKMYPDKELFVEGARLDSKGGLQLFRTVYWENKPEYVNKKVNFKVIEDTVLEVYDENGNKIYPFDRYCVYKDYRIVDGRMVDGEFVRSFETLRGLKGFFRNNEGEYIIKDLQLDERGGLCMKDLDGNNLWKTMAGYENGKVTAEVVDGRVKRAYNLEGEQIFPATENMVWEDAEVVDGIRQNGTLLCAAGNRNVMAQVIKNNPEKKLVIEKVKLNANGGLNFLDKYYWRYKEGYKDAFVTVISKDGEVTDVFNEEGVRLYPDGEDKGALIFDRLLKTGDLEKLFTALGPEGANRVILRFFSDSFTPKSLLEYTQKYLGSLPRRKAERLTDRKRCVMSISELSEMLKGVKLFQDMRSKTDVETFTEELIRTIYPYLVEDHTFLDSLQEEVDNNGLGLFLKQSYKRTIAYYKELGEFEPQHMQSSTKLKFYQKIGIKFILNKKKVILADEPGLGKTIQALAASVNAYEGKGARKVLIISPHVSKSNIWEKQIGEHLRGEEDVMVLKSRKDLDNPKGKAKADGARFIIANYELIRGEGGKSLLDKLKEMGIDFIIADEAHRIRNDSEIAEAVKKLDAPYKVLVTGTPLVGRDPAKLFNLLNWMYPELYPSMKEFKKLLMDKDGLSILKENLQRIMMRRYAVDVLADLPKLNVEIRPVTMKGVQARLYRQIDGNVYRDKNVPIISQLDLLRRAAIDTALIRRIRFIDENTDEVFEVEPGAHQINIAGENYNIIFGENGDFTLVYTDQSGKKVEREIKDKEVVSLAKRTFRIDMARYVSYPAKYEELDGIVSDVVGKQYEKLVVFTGVVRAVKDLTARYEKQGYEVMQIYGDITHSRRKEILREFNDIDRPVILICTYQTGGESIDLSGARYGVILDEPWTVQEHDQIIKRLHRLGQKQEATFYILEARKSIDERIQEIQMEGDKIQKIVLDDPRWRYNNQKEIIDEILATRTGSDMDEERLREIMLKTRNESGISLGISRPIEKVETILEDGKYMIEFSKRKFRASFFDGNSSPIYVDSFKDLFIVADRLDDKSKFVLKEFFLKQFKAEHESSVLVKDTILWNICEEVIPGFRDIDYHGRLELMVEVGSYIIRQVIENPEIESGEILGKLENIPGNIYEETMYYLDSVNIFKLLSTIGLIPQTYYYKGKLMHYASPIEVYYERNGLRFYDRDIVNSIAPDWRSSSSKIAQDLRGFRRDAVCARKLERGEEFRLARQLEMGNKAAAEVLVASNLRLLLPVAGRVKSRLRDLFGDKTAGAVEFDEICSVGRTILTELVERYAQLGAYERLTLKEYLQKRLNPRMYSAGYSIVKEKRELTLDGAAYDEDSGVTNADLVRVEGIGSARLEAEESVGIMKKILAIMGFTREETELIELFVIDGYSEEEIVEWHAERTGKKEPQAVKECSELIARFQKSMEEVGKDNIRRLLEGEEIDSSEGPFGEGAGAPSTENLKKETDKNEASVNERMKRLNSKCTALFSCMDKCFEDRTLDIENKPVDIVVDLTLIPDVDKEANIKTWAYLMLLCRKYKNINYIFEVPEIAVKYEANPALARDIANAVPNVEFDSELRKLVKDLSKKLNVGADEVERLMNGINMPRRRGAVEIPIYSRSVLELQLEVRKKSGELRANQYPVAMDEYSFADSGVAVRNFEAAMMIALAKSALVIAKRKDEKNGANAKSYFNKLVKEEQLLSRMKGLYGELFDDEKPINEYILESMVFDDARTRIKLAISLALPPICRRLIDKLHDIHEMIHDHLMKFA